MIDKVVVVLRLHFAPCLFENEISVSISDRPPYFPKDPPFFWEPPFPPPFEKPPRQRWLYPSLPPKC